MDEYYENDRRKFEYLLFKRNQKYTIYGIVSALTGLTIFLIKDYIFNIFYEGYSLSLVIIGVLLLAFGLGLLLYRYLQTGISRIPYDSVDSNSRMRNEIEELRLEVMRMRKKSGLESDVENLNETINNIINNTLSEEFISAKIDDNYSKQAVEKSKLRHLYQDFEDLSYRIEGELARLRRSANLNLVIGTLTTTLAITALGYEVFKNNLDFTDTVKLLSHYLPRLSLVVFIEIFAFFFLKLYKANLQDIKYFNNEKTNIDFKIISLKTAIQQENQDLIKLSVEELIKTERNFKLGKDESTVELQKLKNYNENNKLLSQIIGKLTDKL